ncbi:hypothetical protein H0H81_006007, partial [Sphagnurus paluster]
STGTRRQTTGFGASTWTSTWLSMLRRAGLVHRQYLELFAALGDFRAPSRVISPPFYIRCPASTAAAQRPNHLQSRTPQSYLGSIPPPTKPVPEPALPTEIFFVLQDLFSRAASDDDYVLAEIRASPSLLRHLTDRDTVRQTAEALASTNFPLHAIRFLTITYALGCVHKANAYEGICFQLAQKKHWKAMLSVVSQAKQHLQRLTSRLINWHARALLETQDYTGLQDTLRQFGDNGATPNRRTFHLILSGSLRNCNLSKAKQCILTMTEAGFPPDASTHAIVAMNYRPLGWDPEVEARSLAALPDLKDTTATVILNSLIQLRLDVHDLSGALRLLSLFSQSHSIMKAMTIAYPRTTKSNTNDVRWSSPTPLNILPNATTFSLFLNYQATQSNLHGCIEIFNNMVAFGIQPTPTHIASLIRVFFVTGKGDTAVRLVSRMCDPAIMPPSLFEPILSPDTGDDLPWTPPGMLPTMQVFNALLRGLLHTRGLQSVEPVFRIIHASKLKPTAATLTLLLAHFSKVERSRPGVLLQLLRHLSSDIQPTMRHLHIIFSSVIRHEKYLLYGSGWDTIAAKFSTIRKEPERRYPQHRLSGEADSYHPTAGIELSQALSYRRLVRPSVHSLLSHNVHSDAAMISLRILHDALIKSDIQSARQIFHTLLDRGIRPNEYHFTALMEGLVQSGDVDGALDVMRSAHRAKVNVNIVMFTILIVGHARQGNPDQAIKVFQDMIAAGLEPDVPAIDALVGAFFAIGAYSTAKKVLISLWSWIQPFPEELKFASLKTLAQTFRSLTGSNRTQVTQHEKRQCLIKLSKMKKLWESQGSAN